MIESPCRYHCNLVMDAQTNGRSFSPLRSLHAWQVTHAVAATEMMTGCKSSCNGGCLSNWGLSIQWNDCSSIWIHCRESMRRGRGQRRSKLGEGARALQRGTKMCEVGALGGAVARAGGGGWWRREEGGAIRHRTSGGIALRWAAIGYGVAMQQSRRLPTAARNRKV